MPEGLHGGPPGRYTGLYSLIHLMPTEENLLSPRQSFLKEAIIWKRLRHPNVVPFIGVTRDPLQFVSEYMPNGTLTRYVKNHPSADRIELVSLSSVVSVRPVMPPSQALGCGRGSQLPSRQPYGARGLERGR